MMSSRRTTPKDLFFGEVKTRDVFPLLILHLVREEPGYGNSIMAQIREISEVSGAVRGLRRYQLDRVCFPPEVKEEIYALYHAATPAPTPVG